MKTKTLKQIRSLLFHLSDKEKLLHFELKTPFSACNHENNLDHL